MIAVGNKHEYGGIIANLEASGSTHVGVATLDRRLEVLNNTKKPEFCGQVRGGYGNPFNVLTKSGKILSTEFTETISTSLTKKGYNICQAETVHTDEVNIVLDKFRATDAQKLLIIYIHSWRTETYIKTTKVICDLSVQLIGSDNKVICEHKITGDDVIGGSFWNPPKFARKNVPKEYIKRIERLLNEPKVVEALNG